MGFAWSRGSAAGDSERDGRDSGELSAVAVSAHRFREGKEAGWRQDSSSPEASAPDVQGVAGEARGGHQAAVGGGEEGGAEGVVKGQGGPHSPTKQQPLNWNWLRHFIVAIKQRTTVAVLAWLTSILALVMTGIQSRATEVATERAQRAWVTVDHSDLGNLLNTSAPTLGMVFLKNSGPSPASNVRPTVRFVISYSTAPPWQLDRVHEVSVGIIGPGGTGSSAARLKPPSRDDVAAIGSGKAHLFLYGIVTYDDIFGKSRWTKFCFRNEEVDPLLGPLTTERGSWASLTCGFWNEMN